MYAFVCMHLYVYISMYVLVLCMHSYVCISMYSFLLASKHNRAKRSMKTYSWRSFWDVFCSVVCGGTQSGKLGM